MKFVSCVARGPVREKDGTSNQRFWLRVHFVSVGECGNNKHLTMQPSLQQSALINTSNSNYVLFKLRTNNRRCQCVVWHFLISLWIFMRWSNNACYSSLCCFCVCLLHCCLSASIQDCLLSHFHKALVSIWKAVITVLTRLKVFDRLIRTSPTQQKGQGYWLCFSVWIPLWGCFLCPNTCTFKGEVDWGCKLTWGLDVKVVSLSYMVILWWAGNLSRVYLG